MRTGEGYGSRVIASPPQPPVLDQPAAYEVSYGIVRGTAGADARGLVVKVDGHVVRRVRLTTRRFVIDLDLPTGERAIRVETQSANGRTAGTTVEHVFGLPRAARPRGSNAHLDPVLQQQVARLGRSFPGHAGIYVQSLTSGAGAAWSARATFPAASTLKLAIAVTVLSRITGPPAHGTSLDGLFRSMLTLSDNASANALERVIGGSTSGGSALVNTAMRSIGLESTAMYGGYVIGTSRDEQRGRADGIPLDATDQPSWGYGKRTTSRDLARLLQAIWLASAGKGPLRVSQSGVAPREARYLLYLLAHVRDPGKLDRQVGSIPGVAVLHKAGWLASARHDNGLVFWRGGVFVATVMTYGSVRGSDVLAASRRRDDAEATSRMSRWVCPRADTPTVPNGTASALGVRCCPPRCRFPGGGGIWESAPTTETTG